MDRELRDLAEELGWHLIARGWHIGVAESCTGGLLGHTITNVAGSSVYFVGGIISYANAVKRDVLGVPADLLQTWGAVSEPVARAMARGVRIVLGAEVGVSTTGIAGPSGGTLDKPVGTVYIGLSTPCGESVHHFCWDSDRLGNKMLSARAALRLACEAVGQGGLRARAP